MVVLSLSEYQDVTAEETWCIDQTSGDFTRLYYIQGGEAYYYDKNHSFPFRKGFLYLLPAGKPYQMRQNPMRPLNHLFCHITTFPKIAEPIELPVEPGSLIENLIFLLKKNIRDTDFGLVTKIVDLLVYTIFRDKGLAETNRSAPAVLKDYIDNHFEEELNLDSICDQLHFSKSYLIRSFSRVYKISPIQYLIKKRLEVSILMLKDGFSINEIVEKLHYSNPSYFSQSFKATYGMSPLNYVSMMKMSGANSKRFLPDADKPQD